MIANMLSVSLCRSSDTLGVAGKKIKKHESRKSKQRKAKKSAKAVAFADKFQTRVEKDANDKKKKEKWKHLWE